MPPIASACRWNRAQIVFARAANSVCVRRFGAFEPHAVNARHTTSRGEIRRTADTVLTCRSVFVSVLTRISAGAGLSSSYERSR